MTTKVNGSTSRLDKSELDYPDTLYIRDIENRVFQSIVARSLTQVEGIGLTEGNLIGSLFGQSEGIKGIWVEQDSKNHSVSVRCELNIAYGISIPQKATEIQTVITQEITRLTGLHVAQVHIIFKNIIPEEPQTKAATEPKTEEPATSTLLEEDFEEEFA